MKFEHGPLHVVSHHPVGDLLDETIEEGFDYHVIGNLPTGMLIST